LENNTSEIAAVVFDFDGTLARQEIDFQRMRADVTAVLHRYEVQAPEILRLHILEMIDAAMDHMQARGVDAATLRTEAYAAIERVEFEAARYARPIPGVREMLGKLRARGIRLGVVTRNSHRAVLTVFDDIEAVCDVVLAREAVRNVKPHPEHLATCLAHLGVPSERAMMVGDHPIDIEAGQRHDMTTVGVLTGNGSAEALREAGADFVLKDATEILKLI
jgi:phosphoglycolate phosphatase